MTVVDLDAVRRGRQLLETLQEWQTRMEGRFPTPAELGWVVVDRDPDGRACQWFLPRCRAFAGYVPGSPEYVFVDYNHQCLSFDCSIEELLLGLETGFLPEPLAVVPSPGADDVLE